MAGRIARREIGFENENLIRIEFERAQKGRLDTAVDILESDRRRVQSDQVRNA